MFVSFSQTDYFPFDFDLNLKTKKNLFFKNSFVNENLLTFRKCHMYRYVSKNFKLFEYYNVTIRKRIILKVKKLSKSNNSFKSYDGLSTDFSIHGFVEETVVKILYK